MSGASSFQVAATAYSAGNVEAAFPLMKKLAEEGHAAACFLLALMYGSGEGTPIDKGAYRYWLEKFESLAKEGNPSAQWQLSCNLRWGNHFPLDISSANHWLAQAAENGDADAQFHLAHYVQYGEYGFEQDSAKAESWLEKAVAQQHPEALYTKAQAAGSNGVGEIVG
jgi:TPR repeat protein